MVKVWGGIFFTFMLPVVVYEGYTVFIVANCDPKFGCVGTFKLTMLISAVFGMISMASLSVVKVCFKTNRFTYPVLAATLLLGCTHGYVLKFLFFKSTILEVLFWIAVSVVVYLMATALAKK